MEGYNEHDPSKKITIVKQASEILIAYLDLDNSEDDKYGSIIQIMNPQKSLGKDQQPRTIVDTNNVLSNHKFGINKHKK